MSIFGIRKPLVKNDEMHVVGKTYILNIPTEIVDDGYGVKLYKCLRCKRLFFTQHDIMKHYRGYEAIKFSEDVKNGKRRNKV